MSVCVCVLHALLLNQTYCSEATAFLFHSHQRTFGKSLQFPSFLFRVFFLLLCYFHFLFSPFKCPRCPWPSTGHEGGSWVPGEREEGLFEEQENNNPVSFPSPPEQGGLQSGVGPLSTAVSAHNVRCALSVASLSSRSSCYLLFLSVAIFTFRLLDNRDCSWPVGEPGGLEPVISSVPPVQA